MLPVVNRIVTPCTDGSDWTESNSVVFAQDTAARTAANAI